MCGRYSFAPKPKQLEAQLHDMQRPLDLKISFNIAPTHQAYVVANDDPDRLQLMQWGLVPSWSPDGKNGGKLINARAEGIGAKPAFRAAVRARRCLVPADSFYEWRTEGKRKIPYRISLKNGELLFLAGIWEEWRHGGELKRTFSIVTTEPNREMTALHNRMPVVLADAEQQQSWLYSKSLEEALATLRPAGDDSLDLYRVSEKLNSPANDGPELHEKVPEELQLF